MYQATACCEETFSGSTHAPDRSLARQSASSRSRLCKLTTNQPDPNRAATVRERFGAADPEIPKTSKHPQRDPKAQLPVVALSCYTHDSELGSRTSTIEDMDLRFCSGV